MIKINLLPVREARKKESIRLQVSVFALSTVAVCLLMVHVWISMNTDIAKLQANIQATQATLQKYQKEVREADKIRKELNKLEKKMDVIAQLEADRTGPVRVMDGLTRLVVEDKMWLTSLTEKKGHMTFKGVAIDNKTVADFMTNLEESPYFGAVDLDSTKQIDVEEKKFKEFTITAPLVKKQPEAKVEAS